MVEASMPYQLSRRSEFGDNPMDEIQTQAASQDKEYLLWPTDRVTTDIIDKTTALYQFGPKPKNVVRPMASHDGAQPVGGFLHSS